MCLKDADVQCPTGYICDRHSRRKAKTDDLNLLLCKMMMMMTRTNKLKNRPVATGGADPEGLASQQPPSPLLSGFFVFLYIFFAIIVMLVLYVVQAILLQNLM